MSLPSLPSRSTSDVARTASLPLLFLLLLFFILSGALQAFGLATPSGVVPFRIAHGFAPVVPVYLNGAGPFDFMIDTGSNSTSVDAALGVKLGLVPAGTARVSTVLESTSVPYALARSLRVGPVTQTGTEIFLRDLGGLRPGDPQILGVLGENFLRGTDFLLDNRHHTLTFDPTGTLLETLNGQPLKTSILTDPGNRDYTFMVVQATLAFASHPYTLLLDSGCASLVLPPSPRLNPVAAEQGYLEDDAGHRRTFPRAHVQLWVGTHRIATDANLVTFNTGVWPIDGFLPTALFERIYISNSAGFLILNPGHRRHQSSPTLSAGGNHPGVATAADTLHESN